MDFSLTDQQLNLRSRVAAAVAELDTTLSERDESGAFDQSTWRVLADTGVLRANLPVEYGGSGYDTLTTVLMLEGLGFGSRDNGLALAATGQIWTVQEPILRFGTDEQKLRYLPALSRGESIGAHAITEPDSGSDSYSLTTTAVKDGDGYVLSGTKTLIGMAPVCDVALVFAKTAPEHGRWGISAFLVDTETPGLSQIGPRPKMGLRTNPIGDLVFEDCRVPDSALLGPPGAGLSISTDSLDYERSFILACQVGAMERQLEEAVGYATSRKQFGQSIGGFQSVSNRLADMKMRLDVAKLLLYRAAWLKDQGKPAQLESALTKLHIAEAFVDSSLDSIRIHGGVGYLTEHGVERDLRDAVGGVIYGGTSDIQRQVIARLLGVGG